jgi:cell division protein FtsB
MNIHSILAPICAGLTFVVAPQSFLSQDDDRFQGKSKKDLQMEILQMETDCAAKVSDLTQQIKNETQKADALKESNSSKDMELKALRDGVASQEIELTALREGVASKETELVGLQAELAADEAAIHALQQTIDSLQTQALVQPTAFSNIERGVVGDVFDFRIEMEDESSWGSNPIRVTPVGWSPDGKFCYIEEYCNGGCGCCSMSLNVFDAERNVSVMEEYFDSEGYEEMDSSADLASTRAGIANQLVDAFATHGILPLGIGHYQPKTNANPFECNPAMWTGKSFEVEVVKGTQEWNIVAKSATQSSSVLATVAISINEQYDTESPESVAMPGVITNPWGNHTLAVYFTETLGYEAERDWRLNLATVPNRFISN